MQKAKIILILLIVAALFGTGALCSSPSDIRASLSTAESQKTLMFGTKNRVSFRVINTGTEEFPGPDDPGKKLYYGYQITKKPQDTVTFEGTFFLQDQLKPGSEFVIPLTVVPRVHEGDYYLNISLWLNRINDGKIAGEYAGNIISIPVTVKRGDAGLLSYYNNQIIKGIVILQFVVIASVTLYFITGFFRKKKWLY